MKPLDKAIWLSVSAVALVIILYAGCAKEDNADVPARDVAEPAGSNEDRIVDVTSLSLTNKAANRGGGDGSETADEMQITKLRVPLEYNPDGSIKSQLFAEAADPSDGNIVARDVRVEFYGNDGKVEMLIQAGACHYSREEGMVSSESDVRLEESGIVVTGTGFEWESERQIIRILENARVVLKKGMEKSELLRKVDPNG
jgi:hypothetical protein